MGEIEMKRIYLDEILSWYRKKEGRKPLHSPRPGTQAAEIYGGESNEYE